MNIIKPYFNNEELKLLNAKDIKELINLLSSLKAKDIKLEKAFFKQGVNLILEDDFFLDSLKECIFKLKPWRKGPFLINSFLLDSEWRSDFKLEIILKLLKQEGLSLDGKSIADIGSNNGFYMLALNLIFKDIKEITCIDPNARFYLQFYLFNMLLRNTKIDFRLLGLESFCLQEDKKYDILFCLGVLYHRSNIIETLKQLKSLMKQESALFLETLIIDSKEPIMLTPKEFLGMKNIYFIPSASALSNLALKCGFKSCTFLSSSITNNKEQRSTEFIDSKSLGDFLESSKQQAIRGMFKLSLKE